MATPKTLLYAVLKDIYEKSLVGSAAINYLIDKWQNEFTGIRYFPTEQEVTKVAPSAPTGDFDEMWGEDIGASYYDELGLAPPVEEDEITYVIDDSKAVGIYAHVAEGLTKVQTDRMGFTPGGLVMTLLNPELAKVNIKIEKFGKVYYQGQYHSIQEVSQAVVWDQVGGNLFTIINCGI